MSNSFEERGYLVVPDLISETQLHALEVELDALFELNSKDGFSPGSVAISPVCRAITSPVINVRSINLLEFVVAVFSELEADHAEPIENYVLTACSVFHEEGNRKPLFWHTDLRRGMFRAQIYLQGGQRGSGAFKYIGGSHKMVFDSDSHKMSEAEMLPLLRDEGVFDQGAGTTVIFDSYGLHGKDVCLDARRTIMIEFQDRGSAAVKERIEFDTSHMTSSVLDRIHLFQSAANPETYSNQHGSSGLKNHVAMKWDQRLRYRLSERLGR